MNPVLKRLLQRLGAVLALLLGTLLGGIGIIFLTRTIYLFSSRPNFTPPDLTVFTLSLLLALGIGCIEKQVWKRGLRPLLVIWSLWAISLSSIRWAPFPSNLAYYLICTGLMSITLIILTINAMIATATANTPKQRALLPWLLQTLCATAHLIALLSV